MDTECKISVEAAAMKGCDYRTVQLLALDEPWHLMVEEESANVPTAVEGDRQKLDEKAATISGEGDFFSASDATGTDYPILIDFEKICLWDHGGNLNVGIRMEDAVYMKKRLMEWVHAVAAYIRLLHDIT